MYQKKQNESTVPYFVFHEFHWIRIGAIRIYSFFVDFKRNEKGITKCMCVCFYSYTINSSRKASIFRNVRCFRLANSVLRVLYTNRFSKFSTLFLHGKTIGKPHISKCKQFITCTFFYYFDWNSKTKNDGS